MGGCRGLRPRPRSGCLDRDGPARNRGRLPRNGHRPVGPDRFRLVVDHGQTRGRSNLLKRLAAAGFDPAVIGRVCLGEGVTLRDGSGIASLRTFERDEIARVFESNIGLIETSKCLRPATRQSIIYIHQAVEVTPDLRPQTHCMPGEQLLSIVDTYLPLERARFVKGSLKFAEAAHRGQRRMSGEPYIEHPIATATLWPS